MPFRAVENEHFLKLLRDLRPGYKPPNRKQLATKVLDRLFEEEMKKTRLVIKGKYGTLMLDGWSTKTNDPVIASTLAVVQSGK